MKIFTNGIKISKLDGPPPTVAMGLRSIELILNLIAVCVILYGTGLAILTIIKKQTSQVKDFSFPKIKKQRIILGQTINLALTFILAADVVKTIRTPNYYQLGKLVILVGLREFVTYYLDLEIRDLTK